MSEHRRKPPQSPGGGGRAAARRGAPQQPQQPPPRDARRAAPRVPHSHGSDAPEAAAPPTHGGRAAARRAAQGGGRRANSSGGRGGGRGGGQPPKKRIIDYPRWGKDGWRRWMPSWKLVTGLCIGFFGSLVTVAGVGYAMVAVPNPNEASQAQNNVYYWADGSRMVATGGEVNRQIITIDKIPVAMQNAVISAENKTFRTDSGVDPMGIARALFNMAKGGATQGGSTITQQYVKNAMLSQDQTITRKFKELFISIKVGTKLDKNEILANYLNTSYFGRGASGIQAAAQQYYGIDANKLNPSQCAVLAALLKGATYYDPAGNTDIDPAATAAANTARSEARWKYVLDREVIDGNMTATERAKYTKYPMPLAPKKNVELAGQTGYLVDLAKAYFVNNNTKGITADDLAKGGYQIYTTFDKTKVNELEASVKKVQKANINTKLHGDKDKYVQFGGASVSPKDGSIVAIYGGSDWTKHFISNADQTGVQVGSTFKPFVLAAAMTYGKMDPSGGSSQPDYGQPGSTRTIVSQQSVYNGKNKLKIKNYDGTVWTDKSGKEWLQTNDGNQSFGNVTLREAMQFSMNAPYVQLGMDVGTDKVEEAALKAGLLKTSLASSSVPSFSIGTSDPSAIRMAAAYGTFANGGQQNDPYSVTKVEHSGVTVYTHTAKPKPAFSSAVASNVTDVLKNVVDKGTGTTAKLPGRQVAGKTGTTDGNRSAWFVGYTPQLSTAIGMWRKDDQVHKDKNGQVITNAFQSMFGTGGQKQIHGASFPAEIWHDYMSEALKGKPAESFPAPGKLGTVVYGGGAASPTPSASATASATASASASPSGTPSTTPPTASASPTPTQSQTCAPLDFTCSGGGTTTSPTPTTSAVSPTATKTRGFGNGGTGG
ncbi:transglycosylase domain-containing protein [Actinacidiphila oryziradicis]|uniref:transglycosylase domain-containing protein n=1 Tax=Actinacidiphila oryziradicis TaxID=2571141 RepID=UPI0023F2B406|nr:transglycosylase domain-containing protein [Actinacidiphila oryziradicis]MCW2870202.1 penicillin-binding protein [Actinacidiphila oryziradicis]